MIPWDTFKTPQDAYEWAKAIQGHFLIAGHQRSFTAWYLLLDLGPSCIQLCAMPKGCPR